MLIRFIAAMAFLSLASCVRYQEPQQGNEALLKNDPPAFLGHLVSDRLITNLNAIDGEILSWAVAALQDYRVSPGVHTVTANASDPPYISSSMTLTADFKPNTTYYLTARRDKEGHAYEIRDDQGTVVARRVARDPRVRGPDPYIPPVING